MAHHQIQKEEVIEDLHEILDSLSTSYALRIFNKLSCNDLMVLKLAIENKLKEIQNDQARKSNEA